MAAGRPRNPPLLARLPGPNLHLPGCPPCFIYSLLGLAGAEAVGCRSQAIRGLWCGSRLRLFRCPGSPNPLRTAGDASPRCRPSALRRCTPGEQSARGRGSTDLRAESKGRPDPSPAPSGSSVRGQTRNKNRKGPPSPLAAIFRGGRPLYEPTPKNGDRRRRRERQAGRRPSDPRLLWHRQGMQAGEQRGDSWRLPRAPK